MHFFQLYVDTFNEYCACMNWFSLSENIIWNLILIQLYVME